MPRQRIIAGVVVVIGLLVGVYAQQTERPEASGDNCLYRGDEYSHGSVVCQSGRQRRCNDGEWVSNGSRPCSQPDGVVLEEPPER